MEFTQEELSDWSKKLADFKFENTKERTFLEIINAHQIESVSSSILAFILDPNEKHGLGSLGLKALEKVTSIKLNYSLKSLKKAKITCEVNCYYQRKDKAGQIDILIELDNQVIVIENKINHICNNPFEIYKKVINTEYKECESKKFLVIGLKKDKNHPKDFYFISHFQFNNELKKLLSEFKRDYKGDTLPCLLFIEDYLEAMKKMDKAEFFNEKESEVFDFILDNAEKLDQLNDFKGRVRDYAYNYLKQFKDISCEYNFSRISKYSKSWQDSGAYILSEHIRTNNEFFNGFLEMQIGWSSTEIYIIVSGYSLKSKHTVDLNKVFQYLDSVQVKVVNKKTYEEDGWIQILELSPKCTPQKLSNEFNKLLDKVQK